ncbi:hypothetical protein BDV23DRAFT_163693 [Aspergillus alliaceus]|uniref:Uncharacterized protein n=1 Tax=Petromyces alliaceus TaxID=209559 RepID=A0A5N7BWK3_PETAA|nr:hypothetical protein BDV23DRAFT_163693 [Aspergillus alliaceus]
MNTTTQLSLSLNSPKHRMTTSASLWHADWALSTSPGVGVMKAALRTISSKQALDPKARSCLRDITL